MKFICYFLVLVTVASCQENKTLGEEPATETATTTAVEPAEDSLESAQELESMEDIKKEFSYVASLLENGRLDSASINYNCNDEKKGTITYFSENRELRMIKHTYSEYSHFSAVDQYYVKDGVPFFVFYNHLTWSFINQNQNQTKDNITESRFYILDKKPIKCLEKKFSLVSDTKEAPQSDTVPSKERKCPPVEPVLEKFNVLAKYRGSQEALNCLGE